jgi:hypothetical protein
LAKLVKETIMMRVDHDRRKDPVTKLSRGYEPRAKRVISHPEVALEDADSVSFALLFWDEA